MNSQQYSSPRGFRLLPPVIKNLLIINILFFLATLALSKSQINLNEILGLHYFNSGYFRPWQMITYMFMHGGFAHLFFNMFALWMFGYALEDHWGPKKFLIFYFVTGIGAGLIQMGVQWFDIAPLEREVIAAGINIRSIQTADLNNINDIINDITRENPIDPNLLSQLFRSYYTPTVGASGAVYGILLAFGMIFPNVLLFILFIPFPIKAKWVVIGYGALELFSAIRRNNPNDNVAHFAHLGGMLFGFILIKLWQKNKFNEF